MKAYTPFQVQRISGLRDRPTYNELVDYIETTDDTIKMPDRRAKFIRNSFYLSQLDGEGMRRQEEQERQREKEQERELLIRQFARDFGFMYRDIRNFLDGHGLVPTRRDEPGPDPPPRGGGESPIQEEDAFLDVDDDALVSLMDDSALDRLMMPDIGSIPADPINDVRRQARMQPARGSGLSQLPENRNQLRTVGGQARIPVARGTGLTRDVQVRSPLVQVRQPQSSFNPQRQRPNLQPQPISRVPRLGTPPGSTTYQQTFQNQAISRSGDDDALVRLMTPDAGPRPAPPRIQIPGRRETMYQSISTPAQTPREYAFDDEVRRQLDFGTPEPSGPPQALVPIEPQEVAQRAIDAGVLSRFGNALTSMGRVTAGAIEGLFDTDNPPQDRLTGGPGGPPQQVTYQFFQQNVQNIQQNLYVGPQAGINPMDLLGLQQQLQQPFRHLAIDYPQLTQGPTPPPLSLPTQPEVFGGQASASAASYDPEIVDRPRVRLQQPPAMDIPDPQRPIRQAIPRDDPAAGYDPQLDARDLGPYLSTNQETFEQNKYNIKKLLSYLMTQRPNAWGGVLSVQTKWKSVEKFMKGLDDYINYQRSKGDTPEKQPEVITEYGSLENFIHQFDQIDALVTLLHNEPSLRNKKKQDLTLHQIMKAYDEWYRSTTQPRGPVATTPMRRG